MADFINKDHKFWWAVAAAAVSIAVAWGVLEVRAQGIDEHTKAQSGKIEQLRTDAENSRTRMVQSVGEVKELLIELRANSRRLEDKIEALNKK